MVKQNYSSKFETESIKSILWDQFDVFTLGKADLTVTAYNNTDVAFTNCAPFSTSKTEINDLFKQTNYTKCERESIKSSLGDYFHTFILITRHLTVFADINKDLAFTTCAPFSTRRAAVNDWFESNNSSKIETESVKLRLWDYLDPVILVTGDVTVAADNNTDVVFKNCEPLFTCKTAINNLFQENNSTKFENESIERSFLDYFDTLF